jgi:hypothetical protein
MTQDVAELLKSALSLSPPERRVLADSLRDSLAREEPSPTGGTQRVRADDEIPPGIRRSQQAFWRDLPQLLKTVSRKRRWVAYAGDERIGFGSTQAECFALSRAKGLEDDAFYVGKLEWCESPPWDAQESEKSPHELTTE